MSADGPIEREFRAQEDSQRYWDHIECLENRAATPVRRELNRVGWDEIHEDIAQAAMVAHFIDRVLP
jgi:hypothetical protein